MDPRDEDQNLSNDLFDEAVTVPIGERQAWLDQQEISGELATEIARRLDEAQSPRLTIAELGTTPHPEIEGFRFEAVVGRGGMGVVWSARQLQPDRRVAIKLLRAAFDEISQRRFQREIEALGRLEHRAIASVYSAGEVRENPYIVMELVEGLALDRWLERNNPSLESTIALFLQILAGVAHAHGRGIIHRDLKPANILVDAKGRPKILDFGIARSTDDQTAEEATRTGIIVGTIPYMSPEQARGDGGGIDVRSDIYSLGVIFFQLLEGRRPIEFRGLGLPAAIEKICTEAPAHLTRVQHRYGHDLDTILQKALEKEPERRYATADAFSEDLKRLVNDRPIQARSPSAGYLISRFARRNRGTVVAATLAAAVLVAATAVSSWFAWKERQSSLALTASVEEANRERSHALKEARRADGEAAASNAFIDFMSGTILQIDPNRSKEPPTLKDAIQRASRGVDQRLNGRPVALARVHQFLGQSLRVLGDYDATSKHFERAFELFKSHAPEHRDLDLLRVNLAGERIRQGKTEGAHSLLDRIIADHESDIPPPRILGEAFEMKCRAWMDVNQPDKAIAASRKGVAILSALGDEEGAEFAIYVMAGALLMKEHFDESEIELRRLLRRRRARLHKDHPVIAETLFGLGAVALNSGKPKEAIPILEEAHAIQCKSLGAGHPAALRCLRNLELAATRSGQKELARKYARKVKESEKQRNASSRSDED